MKRFNCIIIDDEKPARRLIENYCERIDNLEILGSFKSPLEALSSLENSSIDLLFLDIRMPEISGIDFLKTLHHRPHIILTTAYREYALDAFELDVIDYLLKPIAFPRFLKAVNKVKTHKKKEPLSIDNPSKNTENQFINIKSNKRLYRVLFKEISSIQSDNEYITYYTKNQGKLMVYGSLKGIENTLPQNFYRIHRSYIVNSEHIKYVEGNRIAISESFLTIGESYRKAFFEKWNTP